MAILRESRKGRRTCPHCHSSAAHVACTTCHQDMCEECISDDPDVGKVCGLCLDRADARRRWEAAGRPGQFDEWYDQNG